MYGQLFPIDDPYIYVFFYLGSIFYFLYVANRFIAHIKCFNVQHNHVLLTRNFQRRFILIWEIFLYASIVIFLFREAFMLVNYSNSKIPVILLAVHIIILQILLILLLGKEQLLSFIPRRSPFGEWIYKYVDTYYNLILGILVPLIIMSNPYVGLGGHYTLGIVSRIIATILLVQVLLFIHNFLKRTTSSFFFQIKEESAKERFPYAKTWYGFFVIVTLVSLLALGAVIGSKLWGWPEFLAKIETWEDIKKIFEIPLLMTHSEHPITCVSLSHLLLFLLGGMLLAFIFDRFVLHRIFDVLLVEHGVQNAVSSLGRYIIIIVAIILGIQAVGLGGQVWYLLAALMIGVGWVVKDPAYDFISYFIILIQRPLKIGDYVRFDDDIRGVVRRITPRSVVLRRRNSTTVIVPNSQVMSRSFTNWNYSKGFIAFDDIFVTIDYRENPQLVRDLIFEVVAAHPFVLKGPAPIVRLYRFGAYGYVFQIRGFVSSSYTIDMWEIAGDIRMNIAMALYKKGLKVAALMQGIDPLVQPPQQGSAAPAESADQRIVDE